MRRALGVRAGIRNSRVSLADWARAIGICKGRMSDLVEGRSSMQNGPAMQRLIRLFDALDDGRVHWVRRPAFNKGGRTGHVLAGPERFTPMPNVYSVDFMRGKMSLGGRHEVSAGGI